MAITVSKELTVADHCHAGEFEKAAERLLGWRGIGLRPYRNGSTDCEYADALQWAAVISVELSLKTQTPIGDGARDMLTESAALSGSKEPLAWLGVCYIKTGEYGEADALLASCLDHHLDPATRFFVLRNLASVKTYQSQYDHALRLLDEAEALAAYAPLLGRGKSFLQRGLIHRQRNELDSARDNYEKAASLFEEAGNRNFLGAVLLNLARVFLSKGDYLRAHIHAEHAVSIFESLHDKFHCAKAWDEIAQIYLAEKKLDKAERASSCAIAIIEKGEQGQVLAECLITHAQVLSQRALAEACLSLQRAADICSRLGDDEQRRKADQELAKLVRGAKEITANVAALVRPIEHRLIKESLHRNQGSVTHVSEELGIPQSTVSKKIRTQFPDLMDNRRPLVKRRKSLTR